MPIDLATARARERWLLTPRGKRFRYLRELWPTRTAGEEKEYARLNQEFLKLGMSCLQRKEWDRQVIVDAIEDLAAERCECEPEEE